MKAYIVGEPDGCVLAVVVKDWDDVVIVKEVK